MPYIYKHPTIQDHVAVRMAHCILVFGGIGWNWKAHSLNNIWMYNIYTEGWEKHVTKENGKPLPPGKDSFCAVTIKESVYVFGGKVTSDIVEERKITNDLWKLTRTTQQCFEWNKSKDQCKKKTPSPRIYHCGWQYAGQLWMFGGFGPSLSDYLHNHVYFKGTLDPTYYGDNNQLLCFDPLSEEWTNPETSGTIPKPRSNQATSIIRDKVWMYGGSFDYFGKHYDDLYQLDMVSLTWTEIKFHKLKPPCRQYVSLNVLTEHQLVLHGGQSDDHQIYNDTWILDLLSMTWKEHTAARNLPRSGHTGTEGLNGCVIIIGGGAPWPTYNHGASLRVEPKHLQQLAIQKIYQHRYVLPLKLLPKSLKALFKICNGCC